MSTRDLLEDTHRKICGVAGSLSLAIGKGTIHGHEIEGWLMSLRCAVSNLEEVLERHYEQKRQ